MEKAKQMKKGKRILEEINCTINGVGSSDYYANKKVSIINVDRVIDLYPPGYRFCPTDEELVVEYLMKKVMRKPLPLNRIMDVDLYSCNPQQLSEMYELKREEEWYFFTSRTKKYPNGNRPSRAASNGFWKASGADIDIFSSIGDRNILGYKKALVFYEGTAKSGIKTDWKMQEYRLDKHDSASTSRGQPGDMKLDDHVLCKIYKTRRVTANPKKNDEDQEDGEMQVPTPDEEMQYEVRDEEMLPYAENPRNIQQYYSTQGMQSAMQKEELLQNVKNPSNIQQYQENQGMEFSNVGDPEPHDHNMIGRHESPQLPPFPNTVNYYNSYQGDPGPFDFYFNGSVDDIYAAPGIPACSWSV